MGNNRMGDSVHFNINLAGPIGPSQNLWITSNPFFYIGGMIWAFWFSVHMKWVVCPMLTRRRWTTKAKRRTTCRLRNPQAGMIRRPFILDLISYPGIFHQISELKMELAQLPPNFAAYVRNMPLPKFLQQETKPTYLIALIFPIHIGVTARILTKFVCRAFQVGAEHSVSGSSFFIACCIRVLQDVPFANQSK